MATEMRPGVFTEIFVKLAAKGEATGAAALTSLALAIERKAKENLGRSTHAYGTPTPASSGGPPALVSGTLRRIVTHTRPEVTPLGAEVKVGLAAGFYHPSPPYPSGKKTPASKVGYYLEVVGLRNGVKYPFLHPAFRDVAEGGDVGRYAADAWRHIAL